MRHLLERLTVRRVGAAGMAAAVTVLAAVTGVGAANVNVSKSGWAWGNPTPQGRTLRAIAFSGGVGYAVGQGGTALSTTNAGASFSGLTTGTSADLDKVQALPGSTVVVGGADGCVTRISDDGGQVFRRIFNVAESNCSESVAAFSFLSAKVGFLLLRNGSIELTTDGGESFSRRTGVPGTSASSGGGSLAGTDVHFFSASAGIAFVSDGAGASAAYKTPDGGVSWSAVKLPAGARVSRLYFFDEHNGYAIGYNTLLRTTDGGESWEAEPIAAGNAFSSIDCATATTCLLTVTAGNQLVETTDGGATDTVKTTSSSLLYSAAYATPTQIVAVGQNGATVLSSDGGATFTPASADIGGTYSRLRLGPGGMLLAPGRGGNLAISTTAGQTWQVIATQTSQELVDVAFGTTSLGYALDAKGGLQRTSNGGASWQTLSPGTSVPARAVVALGANTVLLIGPAGISRAVNGGAFQPIGGRISKAHVSDYDLTGSTVFAFAPESHTLIRSTNQGASWSALTMPLAHKKGKGRKASHGVAILSVAFVAPKRGYLLDTRGRLWSTRNGGRSWSEILSAGTSSGIQLAFSDANAGFISLESYGADRADAYVLRTTNGGLTWHPQEITAGMFQTDSIVASSQANAAALIDSAAPGGGEPVVRAFFETASGGDVRGSSAKVALATRAGSISKRRLRAAHRSVRVTGTLAGARGGETIVVSRRNLAGGAWEHQTVVAGANGGSFATTWRIRASSVFVAQWDGDSGRIGQGSKPLKILVR
jgi:photosystem II stability/assembly factor-like uncharacterized protein